MATIGIALLIAVGIIISNTLLSGLGQSLADRAVPVTAPWWLEPALMITFSPSVFGLFLPPFNLPMGLGVNWGSLILLNGVLWGSTTNVLLCWAVRSEKRAVLVKTGLRLLSVIFVWFWVTNAGLHLIDLNYLRESNASTFGSPIFALLAMIIAGILYSALFGPLVLRMLAGASLGRQIVISRILAVTLAVYVFIESFIGSDRNLWTFYLTLLFIPIIAGTGILWIVRHRYGKGDRLLIHA